MNIGILVDSSAGIQKSELKNNSRIRLLPLHLIIEDTQDYLDLLEVIEENKLLTPLKEGKKTTTSQASPGELMNKYDEMLKEFDHVIHLTIPENLSGMRQTAVMVANDDDYKGKVTVINHWIAATALKYLAFKFDQMAKNGETDPNAFQKEATIWEDQSFACVIPSDIQKLASGGRAKSLLITLLKMFKSKVAIQWGEKPKKLGLARTYHAVLEKTILAMKKQFKGDFEIIVVTLKEISSKVKDQVLSFLKEENIDFREEIIPTVFPWHAGIDTIGIIGISKELKAK